MGGALFAFSARQRRGQRPDTPAALPHSHSRTVADAHRNRRRTGLGTSIAKTPFVRYRIEVGHRIGLETSIVKGPFVQTGTTTKASQIV